MSHLLRRTILSARVSRLFPRYVQPACPFSSGVNVSSLADRLDGLNTIVGYDKYGFNVSGVHMRGSILCFNNLVLLWNVTKVEDISPRNLAPVHMISPKPEILIIGTGREMRNVNPALFGYFSRKGISVEQMTSAHAISLFNLLVSEGRNVAAAMISSEPMTRDDASFYTPEAELLAGQSNLFTPQDALITEALALPPGEGTALLTDGKKVEEFREKIESQAEALPTQKTHRKSVAPSDQTVKYGVPGQKVEDVPVFSDEEALESIRRSTARPSTEDELLDSIARRGGRKSGTR